MDQIVNEFTMIIRLCLAFTAGGIIGLERSSRRQVAGLRTHILIAVGACCLMLLSIWLPQSFSGGGPVVGDPGRIAAQVVSGMGFLGAGAIIRLGANTKGLTTAASLWLTAAIGMAIGAGLYLAALLTVILAIIALIPLNKIEIKVFPNLRSKSLEIVYNHSNEPDIEPILKVFKEFDIEYHSINITSRAGFGRKTKVLFAISLLDNISIPKLANALKMCSGIEKVEIKEKF